MLSVENILKAKITEIISNDVSAILKCQVESKFFFVLLSKHILDELRLKKDDTSYLIFNALDVVLSKNECATRIACENEFNGKIMQIQNTNSFSLITVLCNNFEIKVQCSLQKAKQMNLNIADNVNVLINANNILLGINDG
ncbi:hypothetical protein AVCANL279_05535 [Campylobacter canadensis]|uniref:hypothetical protein n=1 Tax=Campylobacter canadensis TaxID=449520 RepID=UPI001CC923D6|nr:hypothetical protein [Campylobacter canadensis]MBZ7996782.1 hypothetical protein [Campylobacter canadensis]